MLRSSLLLVAFLFTLFAAPFAAARDCPKGRPWQCFNEATFERAGVKLHVILFSNDEMMGEIERDGQLRRMIFLGPKRPSLYAGMTREEMRNASPLHFILPLPTIVDFLEAAFPGGPESVPPRPTSVNVHGDRITAFRDGAGVIQYSLQTAELGKGAGTVSMRKVLPLADDYPVAEWQLADGRHLKRLGELRTGASPAAEPMVPQPGMPTVKVPQSGDFVVRAAPGSGLARAAVAAQPAAGH